MPATQCDLDHITPWAETRTTAPDRLAPTCRSDHTIRHRHHWTYQALPTGDYLWTARLGHTYTTTGKPP